jgi:AcrR family transcriptional regulator
LPNRERIVDTAIELFNERATGRVSTNHIAQATGISPGNLYYHFRNKEAIIRAIYARLRPAWEAASALPADRPPTVADLRRILAGHARVVWAYRFYYRELPSLLRQDPELAGEYRQVRRTALTSIETLLRQCIAAGVLAIPDPDAALPELAQVIWILADFWLPFAELGDDAIGPDQLDRGPALVLRVLRPYFTASTVADLVHLEQLDGHRKGVLSSSGSSRSVRTRSERSV